MANAEHSNLPPGVSILGEYSSGIRYAGTERDLIAGGILKPEWIDGLGKNSRLIALSSDGGFQIVGEGKGNRLTHQHRDRGAYSAKRLPDGNIILFKYRTRAEEMAIRLVDQEQQKNDAQQKTWQLAKRAHSQPDLPERWKNGVLHHVEQAEKLIEGKLVFTDFPDIGIQPRDVEAAKKAIAALRNVLLCAEPRVKNKVQQSNVVSLREAAFRYMSLG